MNQKFINLRKKALVLALREAIFFAEHGNTAQIVDKIADASGILCDIKEGEECKTHLDT